MRLLLGQQGARLVGLGTLHACLHGLDAFELLALAADVQQAGGGRFDAGHGLPAVHRVPCPERWSHQLPGQWGGHGVALAHLRARVFDQFAHKVALHQGRGLHLLGGRPGHPDQQGQCQRHGGAQCHLSFVHAWVHSRTLSTPTRSRWRMRRCTIQALMTAATTTQTEAKA